MHDILTDINSGIIYFYVISVLYIFVIYVLPYFYVGFEKGFFVYKLCVKCCDGDCSFVQTVCKFKVQIKK